MRTDYRKRLAALGFSRIEIDAIEYVLIRMGFMTCCQHDRPKFVECYARDEDGDINEARWRKGMASAGFREDAVILAERGLGLLGDEGGTA
jgi:hypothetical protein